MQSTSPAVRVEPLSARTRAECLALAVHADQRRFVAAVEHYVALCDEAESPWNPVAVLFEDRVVGFVMWGFDPDEGSHWIGGLLIGREHQRRGLGRSAMRALIDDLAGTTGCHQVALSYHADNWAARRLYESLEFRETGELTDEGELVARLHPCRARR